jgi:hypothetical protein
MPLPHTRRTIAASAAALSLLALATAPRAVNAQIGGVLRGAMGRAAQHLPNADNILSGTPPITSNIADAVFAVDSLDNFTPREAKRSLLTLLRTPSGGFVLRPGYYEFHAQSYCLHAGTHGPGGGDGYLLAPTRGPAEDAVETILRNSVQHPEIDQHNVQYLLWAIIARAKFEDLPADQKATAARLLSPRQLAALNRNALDLLPGPGLQEVVNRAPAPLRAVLEAEANLRKMMLDPTTSFSSLERVAVLAGAVGLGPGSVNVPSGRWSLHPDGYYIRFFPHGYSYTVEEIWVPQGSPAVGKEYDPSKTIAMPGNTARQRLVQSGREHAHDS